MRTLIGVAVTIVVAVIAVLFIFNFDSTDVDEYGLKYSAGPIEGKHFEGFVPPGSSLRFLGVLDYMDTLPANQRTYIVGDSGSDATGDIVVTDGQGVELGFKTSSTFELVNDPKELNTLNLQICTKYDGCYDNEGTTDDGWGQMLNDYYRKAQESALQTVARQYDTDELMQGDLTEFNKQVADATQEKVQQNMGGKYLTDVTFQIQRPIAPKAVQDKYNAVKAAALQTQVKKQEVNQANQQAKAADQLQETLQQNPNYLKLRQIEVQEEAVEHGKVTFWVLPDNANLTTPTP